MLAWICIKIKLSSWSSHSHKEQGAFVQTLGAVGSSGLSWGWDDFRDRDCGRTWLGLKEPPHSGFLTWLLAAGLSSSHRGLLHRVAWASSEHGSWLPQGEHYREAQGRNHSTFQNLVSASHIVTFAISSVRSESLNPVHIQEKGKLGPLFKGRIIKESVDIF